LHFHCFDYEKTFARANFLTDGCQNSNNFSRHRRDQLLASFEFCASASGAPPGARVYNLRLKFAAVDTHQKTIRIFFGRNFE
jgi:hypothetical protein